MISDYVVVVDAVNGICGAYRAAANLLFGEKAFSILIKSLRPIRQTEIR
ncbi:hypothetical protein KCP73_09150 [Salmonella enterica subsp. enterica]|nr:hypothetical protein KCP73_09150 [Salmonella enterica subsp. enterica]